MGSLIRGIVKMKTVVGGALAALALLSAPEAAAADWQFWNNCWQDFDVGGGWFCGLRSRQCATAGATDDHRVHCTSENLGTQLPPSYKGPQPRSKAIALDSVGYVFLVDNSNKIWVETQGTSWVKLAAQPTLSCIGKLVAAGHGGLGTTTLLALGCDADRGRVHRYANGVWTGVTSDVLDISVANWGGSGEAIWGHNTFMLLQASGDRALWYTGDEGVGDFSRALASTTVTESWSSGGQTYQVTHKPVHIGGRTGYFGEFTSCPRSNGSPPFGERQFHAYKAPPASPLPSGTYGPTVGTPCPTLRLPIAPYNGNDPAAWVSKVVTGRRGPAGFEGIWILTNATRVYTIR
jgi:hypothetical protein